MIVFEYFLQINLLFLSQVVFPEHGKAGNFATNYLRIVHASSGEIERAW